MRSEYITALFFTAILLTSCAPPARKAVLQTEHDATTDTWYATATAELTGLNAKAEQLYSQKKADQASALIEQGETVAGRLLSVPRPTLAATEAASDLDDLYGRMLFGNRHYGWARLQFQKNLARWKRWQPETPASVVRRKQAQDAIDQCDRKLESTL